MPPSSGKSAINVQARTGPTPGIDVSDYDSRGRNPQPKQFAYCRSPAGHSVLKSETVDNSKLIAECEAYIAKQRDLIERAIEQGRSTEVAEETLEALEASLRALERQRQRLLDRLKERE